MSSLKRVLLAGLRVAALRAPLERMLRGRATIFMLHRFQNPELAVPGHDPEELRQGLALLRREGHALLPLQEIFRRLEQGPPLDRAIAFTLDDGYEDQAEVAGPVFAEFDCPVTTFVCTGFLDRALWMWWDQVEYVFANTPKQELSVPLGDRERKLRWRSETERWQTQLSFTEACKSVPDAERHAAIVALARVAEVELPDQAPPAYAPMSWNQLRRAEHRGMSFGPHTTTHPVLSRTPDEQARREIEGSRDRLKSEAADPEPIFCYPNGQWGDFGAREYQLLEAAGFQGAVVGEPGYASAEAWPADPHARFQVRRFSYPGNQLDLLQYASGLERLKARLRRES